MIVGPSVACAVAMVAASYSNAPPPAEPGEESLDHTIIFGVGGDVELELDDGSVRAGGNVMVEWDAIEDWLELEVGASVLPAPSGTAVPMDLLVKKPFRITRGFELMIGAGPEVVHVGGADDGWRAGVEGAVDLMFWPTHRFGFWFEPAYDVVFHDGVSSGLGGTGGLLVGW